MSLQTEKNLSRLLFRYYNFAFQFSLLLLFRFVIYIVRLVFVFVTENTLILFSLASILVIGIINKKHWKALRREVHQV